MEPMRVIGTKLIWMSINNLPRNPQIGLYNIPADTLINCPYYNEYKTCFDLIWYNDKRFPQYI